MAADCGRWMKPAGMASPRRSSRCRVVYIVWLQR